jgi:DNA-binding beta-propeller fold protein YncE
MQMQANIKRKDSIPVTGPIRRWRVALALFGGIAVAFFGAVSISLLATVSAAQPDASNRIYWSNFYGGPDFLGSISYANLDGSGGHDLNTTGAPMDGPMGMAIDAAVGRVYWTNFGNNNGGSGDGNGSTIDYANLDGSGGGVLPIPTSMVVGPHGLAIDSAAGKMYWPNFSNNTIAVANLDGSDAHVLPTSGAIVNGPRGVALDTKVGRIYWANYLGNSISWANLDGSGGGDLVNGTATVDSPEGVALDPASGRLFFGDFLDPPNGNPIRIASVNTDASGGADVDTTPVAPNDPHGVAVDSAAGRVYWAEFLGDGIAFANLNGGGGGDLSTAGTSIHAPVLPVLLKAPAGVGAPSILGRPAPRSTLGCTQDKWAPDLAASQLYRVPQSFSYQWSMQGNALDNATSKSLTARAVGNYRCLVTADNTAGSDSQTSDPYAVFKIGRAKLNTNQGTARLRVKVPGSGKVTVSGKGIVKEPPTSRAGASNALARKAGTHIKKLLIKPKGKVKRRLDRTGRAKVKVTVTDTPNGGSPDSQTKTVKLRFLG